MNSLWARELRRLHEENFFDWTSHLRDLNRALNLVGPDEFTVPNAGLPPSWFVGDVEVLQPGRWVLVVSLNHGAWAQRTEASRREQRDSIQKDWDYWRWLNRNDWYAPFYSPLVRLAATTLGEEIPDAREKEQEFATTRMAFVESCPYSSKGFALSDEALTRLATQDRGFEIAARVRQILIREARPALVMVNGNDAITTLRLIEGDQLQLQERPRYQSISKPGKLLRHWEGRFTIGRRSVPVLAFPFLRKPRSHNFYAEIDQLGSYARALVGPES